MLAFWAGRCSSDIRDELIQSWQNDTELDIQNKRVDIRNTKGRIVYQEKFLRSRFCICPGAPHVHGARIAEAIHYGCVPGEVSSLDFSGLFLWKNCFLQFLLLSSFVCLSAVILSDYSVLPFNDILDWRKFSVVIKEKDVHQLKNILKNITDEKYRSLQNHAIKVRRKFPSALVFEIHSPEFVSWTFFTVNYLISFIPCYHESDPEALPVEFTVCKTRHIPYDDVWAVAAPPCCEVWTGWQRNTFHQ